MTYDAVPIINSVRLPSTSTRGEEMFSSKTGIILPVNYPRPARKDFLGMTLVLVLYQFSSDGEKNFKSSYRLSDRKARG